MPQSLMLNLPEVAGTRPRNQNVSCCQTENSEKINFHQSQSQNNKSAQFLISKMQYCRSVADQNRD